MTDIDDIVFAEYERRHPHKTFVPGKTYIPPSGPHISKMDIVNLVDTVLDGWFTEYKEAASFSRRLAEVANKKHVTLVNSGSSANLVAISAVCEDNPAPYFLTSAAAFPTTVAPIYQNGRTPVFVDIDPFTLLPKYEQVQDALEQYNRQIAGVILIHNLGFPYNEQMIRSYLSPEQKFVVDGCDALGAYMMQNLGDYVISYPVGSFGDYLTYSFFPAHVITTGEGGAVLTDDDFLHGAAQGYCNWGRSCFCLPGQTNTCGKRFEWDKLADLPQGFDHKYVFDRIGYNLKMTELQASLGNTQIMMLSEFIDARIHNYTRLLEGLAGLYLSKGVRFYPLYSGVNPFGFPMLLPDSVDTQQFVNFLESKKVGTRRFFAGNITKQPGYYLQPKVVMGNLYGADLVMNKLVWIGCHPALNNDKIDYMIDSVLEYFGAK